MGAGARGGGAGGGLFGDEFEAFEDGFVEFLVGVVDEEADFGLGGRLGCGEHVFDEGGEVGEGLDEGDDAFAFLHLDFGVFDAADLFFDEAGEKGG